MLNFINKIFSNFLFLFNMSICLFIIYIVLPLNATSNFANKNVGENYNFTKKTRNIFNKLPNKVLSFKIPKCEISNNKFPWNFEKAKIIDIIEQISRLTCKSFILSNNISSLKEITILSRAPVTVNQAWSAFQSALSANDLALVKIGKFYKVIKRNQSVKSPLRVISNKKTLPFNDEVVTYVHELQYTSKDSVKHLLKALISRQGKLDTVGDRLLVITDGAANIHRVINVLSKIDISGGLSRIHLVDLIYADAKYMQHKLKEIFQISKKNNFNLKSRLTHQIKDGSIKIFGKLNIEKIIADEVTNKLVVIASNKDFLKVKEVISMLDVSFLDASSQGKIHVYQLKNNDAKKISIIISNLTQIQTNKVDRLNSNISSINNNAISNLFKGDFKITADQSTNSLIVMANSRDFRVLRKVIDELDKPKTQVYVEAAILELSFSNNKDISFNAFAGVRDPFGKNALLSVTNPGGRSMINDMMKNVLLGSSNSSATLLTSMLSSISYFGKSINIGNYNIPGVRLLLNALEGYTNVNVLATPSMMTLDNEKTEISVGKRVPIIKSMSQIGGNGYINSDRFPYQNITYEDVKLDFSVIPHVNNLDQIRLEIVQNVNDIGETKIISGRYNPVINTKSVKTTVVTSDQQTVVIGGLINYKIRKIESKIPILGDIPVLGWFFKTWIEEKEKSNLLIVLTPYIIRNQYDYKKIYLNKMKYRKKFINYFLNNKIKKHTNYTNIIGPVQKLVSLTENQIKNDDLIFEN